MASRAIFWNALANSPDQLPRRWWLPASRHNSSSGPCHPSLYVTYRTDYGKDGAFNNQLVSLAHALQQIVEFDQQPTLVLSDMFEWRLRHFDWRMAFKSWACVASRPPRGMRRVVLNPADVYLAGQSLSGEVFIRRALTQLLLRPSQAIRKAVSEIRGLAPEGYIGVHVRDLTGLFNNKKNTGCLRGHHHYSSMRYMENEYLHDQLQHTPATLPLYVSHDSSLSSQMVLERLRRSFDVLNVSRQGNSADLHVDMVSLIGATYFVGNPASTLSQNVARVREHLLEEQNMSPCTASNMCRCTNTPGSTGVNPHNIAPLHQLLSIRE